MGSNLRLALALFLAGVYLLLFHIAYSPSPCVSPSQCVPPSPILPPSPIFVAWADLAVGVACLLIGGIGLWRRSGATAG